MHMLPQDKYVVVADDQPSLRHVMALTLAREGYTVVEAKDGQDALERIRTQPYGLELLVTDVSMPRRGGVSLALALRDELPHLPIVFVTASHARDAEVFVAADHASVIVAKPFTIDQLASAVNDLLAPAAVG